MPARSSACTHHGRTVTPVQAGASGPPGRPGPTAIRRPTRGLPTLERLRWWAPIQRTGAAQVRRPALQRAAWAFVMTLTELLPAVADPDSLFDAFTAWVEGR